MTNALATAIKGLPLISAFAAPVGFFIVSTVDSASVGWAFLGAVVLAGPPFLMYALGRTTLAIGDPPSRAQAVVLAALSFAVLTVVFVGSRVVFVEDPEVFVALCIAALVSFGVSFVLCERSPIAAVLVGLVVLLLFGATLMLPLAGSQECWNCGEFSRAAVWTITIIASGTFACVILAFMSLPGLARALSHRQ